MKLSIIIPVLDSHEIVRRQLLHFEKMPLPDDVELILVDDGSDPPLRGEMEGLRLIRTNDFRPWTWPLARNVGARAARGEYLLMTDVDHIITKPAIEKALEFQGDKMMFRRRFGVLDENGVLVDDDETLRQWGLELKYLKTKTEKPHPNTFSIKNDAFWAIGGYSSHNPKEDDKGVSDRLFGARYRGAVQSGRYELREKCLEPIYVFPNGRFCGSHTVNPFGMFHGLSDEDNQFSKLYKPKVSRKQGING